MYTINLIYSCFIINFVFYPFGYFLLVLTAVTLSYCQTHIVLLSYCLTVILSYCRTVILSHCPTVLLSYCLTVALSYCLTVLLSYCRTVLLSFCLIHHYIITSFNYHLCITYSLLIIHNIKHYIIIHNIKHYIKHYIICTAKTAQEDGYRFGPFNPR